MGGGLERLLDDLEKRVLNEKTVRYQVLELGLFVEYVHFALAQLLAFDGDDQGIDTWHKHLNAKPGITVHKSWYRELQSIFGNRNVVAHRNVDASLFTSGAVRRYLEVVREKVPDLSHRLSAADLDFEQALMAVQTAAPHRRRAALLFAACLSAVEEDEGRIRSEVLPVVRELGFAVPGKKAGKFRDRLSSCLVQLSDAATGGDDCPLRAVATSLQEHHASSEVFRRWLLQDRAECLLQAARQAPLPVFRIELVPGLDPGSWLVQDARVIDSPALSEALRDAGLPGIEAPSKAELYKVVRSLFGRVGEASRARSLPCEMHAWVLELAVPATVALERLEDLRVSPMTKALWRLFRAVVIDPIEDEEEYGPEPRALDPDMLLGLHHQIAVLWEYADDLDALLDQAGSRQVLVAGPPTWQAPCDLGRAPVQYCLDRVSGAILCPHSHPDEAIHYLGLEATQSWAGLLDRLKERDAYVKSQPKVFWTDPRHRLETARSPTE